VCEWVPKVNLVIKVLPLVYNALPLVYNALPLVYNALPLVYNVSVHTNVMSFYTHYSYIKLIYGDHTFILN